MAEVSPHFQFAVDANAFLKNTIAKSVTSQQAYPTSSWFEFIKKNQPLKQAGSLLWEGMARDIAEQGVGVLQGDNIFQEGVGFHEFLLTGVEIVKEARLLENILTQLAPNVKIESLPTLELVQLLFHPSSNKEEISSFRAGEILCQRFGLPYSDHIISHFYDSLTDKQSQPRLLESIPPHVQTMPPVDRWIIMGDAKTYEKVKNIASRRNINKIGNLLCHQSCWNMDDKYFDMETAYMIVLDYNLTFDDVQELVDGVFSKIDHPIGLIEFAQICYQKQASKIT